MYMKFKIGIVVIAFKLIVSLGLYEGYTNFTMNYNGKYEKRTKQTNQTLSNLLISMLSMYNLILSILTTLTELCQM